MTEDQAREVVWVLAREGAMPGDAVPWTADDRAWATRQALAALGDEATPEAFVTTRARLALGRLLPRDATGQRFLARRWWRTQWVLLAMAVGLLAGLLIDQLGPPLRVNLLAPAVWAVVAWNVVVYVLLLMPRAAATGPAVLLRGWEARVEAAAQIWWRHAAPLTSQRLLVLMHAAAAALAMGLMAGLYLRGLVLDYRAGWQSTFLGPEAVHAVLGVLLAPASALTGVPIGSAADITALRLEPGAPATASAAPWIHLYAATLGLFVVLPRLLLTAMAAGRARRLASRFPLPLDLPGLRSLHPLMRPGTPQPLRLLWAAPSDLAGVRLLDAEVSGQAAAWSVGPPTGSPTRESIRLWATADGDAIELLPLPAALNLQALPAPQRSAWDRLAALWRAPDAASVALQRLRAEVDAVLLVTAPGGARPAWLAALGRPVIALVDDIRAEAPALPLRQLADGWLPGGALLQSLQAALPEDERLRHLCAAWQAHQAQRLQAAMALLARSLARMAVMRVPVPDEGLLARKDDGSAARQLLVDQAAAELQDNVRRLAQSLGLTEQAADASGLRAQPTVLGRVGEGRAAVFGGVISGALAGLKADLLSGGLTMGAGAVAGGVIGALGAVGAARGINVARGTTRSHAVWGDDTLPQLAQALLLPYLQLAHGLAADEARPRLQAALALHHAALLAAWQQRPDEDAVAAVAAPALQHTVRLALGGPGNVAA